MSSESYFLGAQFEDEVADYLARRRWRIIDRHVDIDGIEVDLLARHPEMRRPWLLECKGGIGIRSGLARTDTVKKAIGAAWALRDAEARRRGRYWLVGSVMPSVDSMAHELLRSAVQDRLLDGVGTVTALVTFADALTGEVPDGFAVRPGR